MIIALRGPSGSGKSTAARKAAGSIVSRDSIRAMLTGRADKFAGDAEFENMVTDVQRSAVRSLVQRGQTVIIDDTNLNPGHLRQWRDFAHNLGTAFVVVDVGENLTVDELIARSDIPESVVRKQAKRPRPEVKSAGVPKPYTPRIGVPAITVDIDGTLAQMVGRSPYDHTRYHEDRVNYAVAEVMDTMSYAGHTVILLSGRSEDHRAETEAWLEEHGIIYDRLIMRKSGDQRNDGIVKSELWDEYIDRKYNVLFHLDDRQRVVDALRAKGVAVWQVAPGNF